MKFFNKNKIFYQALSSFICLVLLFLFITPSLALAESGVPSILSYQGRLTDAGGNLLGGSGTPYFFKFSFWDNAVAGSGTQVWPATNPGPVSLTVKQGVFNVNIGDIENSYPDILNYNFGVDKKIYLQVEVSANNSSFETLSPRQRITSAPFAEVAGSLTPDYVTSIFSNYFTKNESNNLFDPLGAASSTASSTLSNWLMLNPTFGTNTGDNATNTQYSDLATSKQDVLSGTGFIKANGTNITYDNNTYLTAETDPLFTAWDKHAGISITESQISDLKTYLTSSSLTPYAKLDGSNQPFTGNIGIKVATPLTSLHVVSETDSPIFSMRYGGVGGVMAYRANGTVASPTTLTAGDSIGGVAAKGWNGSNWTSSSVGSIYINAAETWTASKSGSYISFNTTPIGSAVSAQVMRISDVGNVGIGRTEPIGKLDVNGVSYFGTRSVDYTSGAPSNGIVVTGPNSDTGMSFIGSGGSAPTMLAFEYSGGTSIYHVARIGGLVEAGGGGDLLFQTAPSATGAYTTKMFLSRAGNLGIGDTAPTSKLSVKGTTDIVQLKILGNSTQTSNLVDVFDSNGTTPRFHVDYAGKVGIGTTAPGTILDVVSNASQANIVSSFSGIDTTTDFVAGVTLGIKLLNKATGAGYGTSIDFSGHNIASSETLFARIAQKNIATTDGAESGSLLFLTKNAGTIAERMRIDNVGNVGIGTTAPLTPAHIVYPFNKTDTTDRPVFTLSSNDATPATSANKLTISSTGDAATQVNRKWNIQTSISSTYAGNLNLQPLGGNVGIGTVSPGYLLDVSGATANTVANFTGGNDGTSITRFVRTTSGAAGDYGIGIPGGRFAIRDNTNSIGLFSLYYDASGTPKNIFIAGQDNGANTVAGVSGIIRAGNAGTAGTDIVGGNLYFATGKGNGAGTPADIYFQTTDALTSGTTQQSFSTKMTLKGNGNVGIGTTTPGQKLTVTGNAQFTAVASGAFSSDLSLTADGTLTTSASDSALKMNLEALGDTANGTSSVSILDKVMGLKPYKFNWISDPTGSKDIGLVAQDVEGIFPEITFTNKVDGYKGINYSRLPVILVSAIQELNEKVSKAGSYVVDGVASYAHVIATTFTGEDADIKNIKTEKVCIGETCIDEAMLKEIILKNSTIDSPPDPDVEDETATSTASTTEPVATTTEEIITDATSTDPIIEEPEATSTEEVIPEATSTEMII
jgi:hypothetical protein